MNETYHIRFARPDDRGAVARLLAAMGGHDEFADPTHPFETFVALLSSPEDRVLVAERDGSVVGIAAVSARRSMLYDRREAWLSALAVAPDTRSAGIGEALLARIETEAARMGCAAIVLESSTMRERAHAFYRRNGFRDVRPALRFERPLLTASETLADRFLDAAARAATRVADAVAGRSGLEAVGIGADGAPTENADAAAERAALEELLPLGLPIVSEEAGVVNGIAIDPEGPWISLDPLDGSRNFVAGYPMFATSIGLVVGGRAVAGLVADLTRGTRWMASAGRGATRDGRAIQTRRSALATMPSPLPGPTAMPVLPGVSRMRMSGSTASDLVRVADGTLAAFYALDRSVVHVHDLAAAMSILEEAGGCAIDRNGECPTLVPDPAVTFDLVAACDRNYAMTVAGLA